MLFYRTVQLSILRSTIFFSNFVSRFCINKIYQLAQIEKRTFYAFYALFNHKRRHLLLDISSLSLSLPVFLLLLYSPEFLHLLSYPQSYRPASHRLLSYLQSQLLPHYLLLHLQLPQLLSHHFQ
jgi:hypothetical protein